MSEVIDTPVTDETAVSAPEWTYDPKVAGDDNSRVADPDAMLALIPQWESAASRAVTETKRFRGATAVLAGFRVDARANVILPNGFPDWAADSDAYKQAVRAAESGAMAKLTKPAAKQLGDAAKQQVRRNFLTSGVVSWILTHENGFGEEASTFFGEKDEEGNQTVPGDPDAVLTAPSDKLKARVRQHYDAAGLKLEHPAFREKAAVPGGGNPPSDPDNPLTAFRGGLGSLKQVTPRFSVAALLETASEISSVLLAARTGEIEGRSEIISQLERVATIAMETASALVADTDGKHDADALKAAMFDKSDVPAE